MSECILWSGSIDSRRYASARIGGKTGRVHRYVWSWINGVIPDGMHVLHRCDVRACVNPEHLFVGTHADNMADMRAKGRRKAIASGESNGRAVLNSFQVDEIRKSALSQRQAAVKYGVHRSQIQRIRAGKQWLQTGL